MRVDDFIICDSLTMTNLFVDLEIIYQGSHREQAMCSLRISVALHSKLRGIAMNP